MYTVYMHISPTNKVYIGITSQEPKRRWKHGHGYADNDYFTKAICKYGWDNFEHRIICENVTKEEAENIEIALIKQYKADNREYGYNIKKGGSTSGKHSDETKRRISEALRGEKNPRFGKKFVGQMSNRVITEEERKRRSLSHKGQIPINRTTVEQYNLNGELIARYESIKYASSNTAIDISCISRCIKGERKTAGGFVWKKAN